MKTHKRPLLLFLAVAFSLTLMSYVVVRTILFFFAEYGLKEKTLSLLLILGEFFVIVHVFGYMLNVARTFRGGSKRQEGGLRVQSALGDFKARVAILVTSRHEPRQVLENTLITIKNMRYPHKDIYLLDDSTDLVFKEEAQALAKDYEVVLFSRPLRHGAKAGILNDCLKELDQKYIVLFDADQNPLPEFLNLLVPRMERDDKLGFIQTPQFYSNLDASRVARGAAFQQSIFYEYICEGKGLEGAMFSCGTNIIFRREALVDIGGFDESSVTEDFASSLKCHSRGWRSLYYDHVCVFGMAPLNLSAYYRQQFRWAAGTLGVFRKLVFCFLRRPMSLNILQWWEYFLSSTYYLFGLAFFFLMACPVVYLFFKVPSFFARPEIYFLAFLPYIGLSLGIFYLVLSSRHYKPRDLFLGQLLAYSSFSVYIRGAFCALFGIRTTFGITEKVRGSRIPYMTLWPQLSMMLLNFAAVIWGVNRFVYEQRAAILVNAFWAFYHFIILASIFYFNEERI